jgi:hypothetical protein
MPEQLGYLTQPAVDVRRYGAVGDGVADDSAAIATAFSLAGDGTLALLFPYGCIFKITRYIEMRSGTAVYLLGHIQLTDRNSGFYANGATNIAILGFKIGGFSDSTVKVTYRFNNYHVPWAPAIHLRSCRNVLIDSLRFIDCPQGVLISNAAETRSKTTTSWTLSQPFSESCTVQGCHFEHCEMSGIASYNAVDTRYLDNYVHRCGDGGIWMMGARDCEVIGNHRISPYANPREVAVHGPNHPEHPGTWNDEQGIEFENCHGLLVAHNVVRGMWANGIDVKNVCNRVLVTGNRVSDCENSSINVREGDAVKDACHKVSIIGNTISGHGTLQYGRPTSCRGAIRVGDCYSSEILDNVIHAYRETPGIHCLGPLGYQGIQYPGNPHQGSLVVAGNSFSFKQDAFENEHEIAFDARTESAIVISGQYDCVTVSGNKVSTDRHEPKDAVKNAGAAISLAYVSGNGTQYPSSVLISDNHISGWGHWGIRVQGLPELKGSGLAVHGNVIASLAGGGGIHLIHTHRALVCGNSINRIIAGLDLAGIWLEGGEDHPLEDALVSGNQISGGDTSPGAMMHGLRLTHCAGCNATNNRISFAAGSSVGTYHVTGDVLLSGTSGFPRSGGGSPQGRVTAYYPGEPYWDSELRTWWTAIAGGSSSWTRATG